MPHIRPRGPADSPLRAASLLPMLAFQAVLSGCSPPRPQGPREATVVAIVLDQSPSMGHEHRCKEVAVRLREYLAMPGTRHLDLAIYGTGDGTEPLGILPWTRWETTRGLYQKPGQEQHRTAAWIADIERRCQGQLRATKSSPIFSAIHRAVEGIRAHCVELRNGRETCGRRFLAVHSDLRESVNRPIVARLYSQGSTTKLPTIDTEGLQLSVCGISQQQHVDGAHPEVLGRVWREVLRTDLPFEPVCPR